MCNPGGLGATMIKKNHPQKSAQALAEPVVSSTSSTSSTSTSASSNEPQRRPWYRNGGMTWNKLGIGMNNLIPLTLLASEISDENVQRFVGLLLLSYTVSALTGRNTMYCILVVPTFWVSLLFVLSLDDAYVIDLLSGGTRDVDGNKTVVKPEVVIFAILAVAVAISITKVNICMSVCLHRYAAHAAFKCGPSTQTALCLLGCMANQGGPIWWASQHRLHHKHCDGPRDPHSPSIDGTEAAFGFFRVHNDVVDEFIPYHLDSPHIWLIDTWAWSVVSLEMAFAYTFFGRTGLFIAYTSGWLCQAITLWFNVANHPPIRKTAAAVGKDGKPKLCKAADDNEVNPWKDPDGVYLPFVVLNSLVPLFSSFVMELEHEHHHDHPMLAKRSKYDVAYWGFLYPLEQIGVVWNVVCE